MALFACSPWSDPFYPKALLLTIPITPNLKPQPLTVRCQMNSATECILVLAGNFDFITFNINITNNLVNIINFITGVKIQINNDSNVQPNSFIGRFIDITLTKNTPSLSVNSYSINDTYRIYPMGQCGNQNGLVVYFTRNTGIEINSIENNIMNDNINNTQQSLCVCNDIQGDVNIPIINISGQTTVNGDYLSDMLFIIKDKYKYYKYCNKKVYDKQCNIMINSNYLKTTTLYQNNIPLEKVLKGKCGVTLKEKAYNINPEPEFNSFYKNLILYAMVKYVLSYILYGKFNLNYLLNKYNNDFFKHLQKSRFSYFIIFFTNPQYNVVGFNKYFL